MNQERVAQVNKTHHSTAFTDSGILQRQCVCGQHIYGGVACEGCRKARIASQPTLPLQAKLLTISEPGDSYEQEADRVAEMVMRMPESTAQLDSQAKAVFPAVPKVQRRVMDREDGIVEIPHVVYDVLCSLGQPLRPATRASMESRFDHDFSKVRIHTDVRSLESAQAINAKAYTIGQDIIFGAGQYAPATKAGEKLLAHELVHVIQQNGASISSPEMKSLTQSGNSLSLNVPSHQPGVRVNRSANAHIQREVQERDFPADGRVEVVRPGEHLIWNFGVDKHTLKLEHEVEIPMIAQEINNALSQNPAWQVDIEGQASTSGNDAINNPLSIKRAQSVRDALVAAGVDAARIRVTSVGSRKGRPATTPENMARSRAVRIVLAPRLAAPQPIPTPTPTPTPIPVSPSPTSRPHTATRQPTCQVANSILSLTGGTVTENRSGQYIIKAGDGTASNLGMNFMGIAMLNRAGCGELLYVQNVKPFRELVYKDGSRCRQETSTWHLDTSDPYPSQAISGISPDPATLIRATNDSPALGSGRLGDLSFTEGVINTMEIRDEFKMFLMLRPPGGARQTLQVGTWTFIGQAQTTTTEFGTPSSPRGTLVLDTSVSRVIPSSGTGNSTSQSPALAPNVTSLRFQVDRAGLPTTRTFADLFVRILNGP